jgi:hypothetical protein
MWGLNSPRIECREKAVVRITNYMPIDWSSSERLLAYSHKPLLLHVSTSPTMKPIQMVVFGGMEGAHAFIRDHYGDLLTNAMGEPLSLREYYANVA